MIRCRDDWNYDCYAAAAAAVQLLGKSLPHESTSSVDLSAYVKRDIASIFVWTTGGGLFAESAETKEVGLVISTKPFPFRQALKLALTFLVLGSVLSSKLPFVGQELLLRKRAPNVRVHFR